MIWKPHATVASVIEQNGRFLMIEERSEGRIQYNQPAGHLEDNESLLDAAIRETREESAHDFTPEFIVGVYLWKHPANDESFLRVSFGGSVTAHYPEQALDEGIICTHWMTRDEVAALNGQLRSPMVLHCIDDYIAGKRYGLDLLSHIT